MKVFAAYYNNPIRVNASSGGLFPCIAQHFLKMGGVVYGVSMSNDFAFAEYKRITDESDLKQIIGSKYLQVTVNNVFLTVKEDLENNLDVFFVGTPCIINGLILYLGKRYSNLFTADIVCHGVPSEILWEKYIEGKTIENVNFRSKKYGWINYGIQINNKFTHRDEDTFMRFFRSDLCLRPSCYNCIPKQNKHSDITLGDFWGIDEINSSFDDDKGASLLIIRTKKGEELFSEIKEELNYFECTYDAAVKNNPSEYRSSIMPSERELFIADINKCNLSLLERRYLKKSSLQEKIKRRIKKALQYFNY